MVFPLSINFSMAVTLLVMLVLQHTYAQSFDGDEEDFPMPVAKCAPEYMEHFTECKGSLNACSTCLGDAERNCDRAVKLAAREGIYSSNGGTCSGCTTAFAGRCDRAETMCFSYQECGDANYHCINFKCEYDPPL